MKRDILYEIYHKNITEKHAQDLYQELFEKFHNYELKIAPTDYLCLSVPERTAFILHDISFTTLALWRYEGWPTVCVACKKPLDFTQGNWRAFEEIIIDNTIYEKALVHWDCY